MRQLVVPCWLAVGGDGDGCPGRQRHSSSCSCRNGRVRALRRASALLYFDYGYGICRRRVSCDGCECFHDGGRGVWGECIGVRPPQVLRTDSGGGSSALALCTQSSLGTTFTADSLPTCHGFGVDSLCIMLTVKSWSRRTVLAVNPRSFFVNTKLQPCIAVVHDSPYSCSVKSISATCSTFIVMPSDIYYGVSERCICVLPPETRRST